LFVHGLAGKFYALGPQFNTCTFLINDLGYQILVIDNGTDPQRDEQKNQDKLNFISGNEQFHG
jgi:hypothetical protein